MSKVGLRLKRIKKNKNYVCNIDFFIIFVLQDIQKHKAMMKRINRDKEITPLNMAMGGCPHFVIAQKDDGTAIGEVTCGFDTDHIFEFIKQIARSQPAFKKALVDYVIDLSKVVK